MFKNVYTTRMSGNSKVLEKRFERISAKPIKFKRILAFICIAAILTVSIFSTLAVAQIANENDEYNIDISIGYPFEEYCEITQAFGKRVHPITGEEQLHTGIDFKAEEGTPVLAGIEGKFDVGYDEEKGAYMTIYGENGVEVTYCNLESEILQIVWRAMYIQKGAVLGSVGNTGKSTGAHLHMEVKVNGEYANPEQYIDD